MMIRGWEAAAGQGGKVMAQPITCDLCHEEPGGIIWSSLVDGSTMAVGENCLPAFIVGLAATVDMVALPADTVPVEMGGTMVLAAEVTDDKPKAKRGRKPTTEAAETTPEPTTGPNGAAVVPGATMGDLSTMDEGTDRADEAPAVAASS